MTVDFTYDDLEVGYGFDGPEVAISREMIAEFAAASFDHNPLHWDDKYMTETEFAGGKSFDDVIAHGLMTYAFMTRAMTDWLWPDNGEHRRLETRFRQPIYPGDTIRIRVEVASKRETREAKWAVCQVTVTNQKDEIVATGDALAEILN